jgi:uncharacterized protein
VSGAEAAIRRRKFSCLLSSLREAESAVLAFSGGVDSSFLLKAMEISGMRVLAVTADSETVPRREVLAASSFASETGVEHLVIRTEELSNVAYTDNPPDRCFFCKEELFGRMKPIMEEKAYRYIFDGSNADDLSDYRPGRRAAARHGVRSPLEECGFSKKEIREMSRELGIDGWDRPSSPCLSSRFPYGRRITPEALRRVEKAEDFLRTLGIREMRVRDYGDTARIEVDEDGMPLLLAPEKRRLVTEALKSFGYVFVSVDLEGYRTGSMNRPLRNQCGEHTSR